MKRINPCLNNKMSVRTGFINTSVFEILQEGVSTVGCIQQDGIDTYPMLGLLLQSVFLRMTGFEEQKLRNICWEVATLDLDYRYNTLQGRVSYGEFSSLDDKKNVYLLLKDKIKEYGGELDLDSKKSTMLKSVKDEMSSVFNGSLIARSFPSDYHQFEIYFKTWKAEHFALGGQLLGGTIEHVYKALFKQRNRGAHNTLSYQQDAITLSEMQDSQMSNCNYFSYFAILLLLDKVFIETFNVFKETYGMRM